MPRVRRLSRRNEQRFQDWYGKASQHLDLDPNPDPQKHQYDYRGFWKRYPQEAKRMLDGDPEAHFFDTFKLPGHPTFSDESRFATRKNPGGHWDEDRYIPYTPMAKKVREYGANSPQVLSRNGVKASDLFAFATGKQAGENVSSDDLKAALTRKGVTARDSRRILDAFDRYSSSGLEYIVSPDGKTYNAFNNGEGLSHSSRKAGNIKGVDAGDLIGLGRHMSTLMGFAGQYSGDYRKSLEKPKAPAGDNTPVTETPQVTPSTQPTGQPAKGAKRGSYDPNRKLNPDEQAAFKSRLDRIQQRSAPRGPSADFEQRLDDFSHKYGSKSKQGNQSSQGEPRASTGTSKGEDMISRLMLGMETPAVEYGLGIPAKMASWMGRPNPDSITPEMSAEEAGLFGHLYAQGKQTVQKRAGYSNPEFDNDISSAVMEGGPTLALGFRGANSLLRSPGSFASGYGWNAPRWMTAGRTVAGKLAPDAGSFLRPGNAAQYGKAAGKFLGDKAFNTGSRFLSNTRNYISDAARRISGNGVGKGISFPAAEAEYEAGFGLPGTPEYFPPGGFRKGGKMPSYAGGGGLPGDEESTFGMGEPDNQYFMPGSFGETSSTLDNQDEGRFAFGTNAPRTGGGDGGAGAGGPDALETFGMAAKYALPFISAGMTSKRLKSMPNIRFSPSNTPVGTVYDIPRPNFGLPYRGPVGADVQSEIGGQKFGEAFRKGAELDYERQNGLSRIEQRRNITNAQSQQDMFNKQGDLNAQIYNSQLAAQKIMGQAGAWEDAIVGTHHNLQGDLSQRAAINAEQQSSMSAEVLRNPDAYTPEQYQAALKSFNRGLGMKKMGGKLSWIKPNKSGTTV